MFDNLSDELQRVFKTLRGEAKLSAAMGVGSGMQSPLYGAPGVSSMPVLKNPAIRRNRKYSLTGRSSVSSGAEGSPWIRSRSGRSLPRTDSN